MSDAIITVENLGKRYSLRHQRDQRYVALRDVITEKTKGLFQKLKSGNAEKLKLGNGAQDLSVSASQNFSVSDTSATREDFWALRDVSFEVKQGEVMGIIGRNGAGKSTLLKILSRITEPTEGRVTIEGRVASLLEVGTGFHPELTGRENIYLNGAILGMHRAEIKAKFDEIVAFAETEKFLDTPVKRYSSGMYVRLAFAVAAHLEPEILIVDEVLAVGDAEFQKKCLGKMESVSKREGRTVLFVSHNMGAVQAMCSRAVYLDHGGLRLIGDTTEVVGVYTASSGGSGQAGLGRSLSCGPGLSVSSFVLEPMIVESGESVDFSICLANNSPAESTRLDSVVILIFGNNGQRAAILDLRSTGFPQTIRPGGRLTLNGKILSVPFVEGTYSVGLFLESNLFRDNVLDLVDLTVCMTKPSSIAPYPAMWRGVVELAYQAEVEQTAQ